METQEKLIYRIDCREAGDAVDYFSCGESRVVADLLGGYRETEPRPLARFGYKVRLSPGKTYRLKVYWPDDRRRFIMIGDGICYDLNTGVMSGGNFPSSGKIECHEEIFRTRFEETAVVFTTWGHGEPAAVQSFEIYELSDEDFAPLAVDAPVDGRRFGLQYEDPCGECASEGAVNFEQWLDMIFRYLRHTGQNEFVYPLCWYHGPNFPIAGERADASGMAVMPDRKQYFVWNEEEGLTDWPARILEKCAENQVDFYAEMRLLRLPSLMADPAEELRFRNGDNLLQTSCMDWTLVYNSANYEEMLDRPDPLHVSSEYRYAYGETPVPGLTRGPIFNFLHPAVRERVREFLVNTCRQYRGFPRFKGLCLSLWGPTILWFGSLRSGYDDLTAGLFCAETGVELAVRDDDPERFAERYRLLTGNKALRERWIAWRCRKVAAWLAELACAIRAVRADLKLNLQLWVEPYIPAYYNPTAEDSQIYLRPGNLEIYREAGLDPELVAQQPGVELNCQADGGMRDRSPSIDPDSPEGRMYRDHDFLDDGFWAAMQKSASPGVYVMNCWNEAWGRHVWFRTPAGERDANAETLTIHGAKGKSCRVNSYYPADGYWWDSQLRITASFAPSPYYMEVFINALARCDAFRLTAGGLYLDKAHTAEFREFACVFRLLPERKFTLLEGVDDPVLVRNAPDGSMAYMLNRSEQPVAVTLSYADREGRGSYCNTMDAGLPERLTLAPFSLHVFRFDEANRILGVQIKGNFEAEYAQAEALLQGAGTAKLPPEFVEKLTLALADRKPVRVRHLLNSYWGAK